MALQSGSSKLIKENLRWFYTMKGVLDSDARFNPGHLEREII
jgi:hypothetical protein